VSRFERLSPERDIQSFTSGNNHLDSWLRDAAVTADRAGTARVYLWLGDDERIIGYYAVVHFGACPTASSPAHLSQDVGQVEIDERFDDAGTGPTGDIDHRPLPFPAAGRDGIKEHGLPGPAVAVVDVAEQRMAGTVRQASSAVSSCWSRPARTGGGVPQLGR
jgi:hypothetical protein